MILDWRQLALCYGDEINDHLKRFSDAGNTTYALLCCRFAPSNARLAASGGEHAERKLLGSSLWTHEIPSAMLGWNTIQRAPIVVTVVINRTPCRGCTGALEEALKSLQWQFPARFAGVRFLLACRGAYQGKVTEAGYFENATTIGGLKRLQDTGWNLCVLQVGERLSPSGQQLSLALRSLARYSDVSYVLT